MRSTDRAAVRYKRQQMVNLPVISLFSYGTLQLPQVQLANYGRLLEGSADRLRGYRLAQLEISDPEVVRISGKAIHTIARATGDPADVIEGQLLLLTEAELAATDAYEVDVYDRVEIQLESGRTAFVYVGPPINGESDE